MAQPARPVPEPRLSFSVLGPLTVERDGEALVLGGPRPRLVLGYLLVNAGTVVSTERLVDALWGDDVPTTVTGPLRTYVSQLRKAMAPETAGEGAPLVRRPPG